MSQTRVIFSIMLGKDPIITESPPKITASTLIAWTTFQPKM